MALITTTKTIDGVEYAYNYSDAGYMIEQDGTGIRYDEALDPVDSGRTYTETDEKIEGANPESIYTELGKILFGEEAEDE